MTRYPEAMRKRTGHSYTIRHNIVPLIGFCLCFYFSWHIVTGERSLARLYTLEQQKSRLTAEYNARKEKREALEARVVKLRDGSIDPDFLEERARYVLGYVYPDEHIVLVSQ